MSQDTKGEAVDAPSLLDAAMRQMGWCEFLSWECWDWIPAPKDLLTDAGLLCKIASQLGDADEKQITIPQASAEKEDTPSTQGFAI